MGGKDCQCTQSADKILNKSKYDFNALLRIIIIGALLAATLNAILYYVLPDYYFNQNILNLTNILIILFSVISCRTLFVGTCCLPNLQMTTAEIEKITNARDTIAEKRILSKKMEYAKTFSQALQIPTISYDPHDPSQPPIDYEAFEKLHQLIELKYPLVHKKLEKFVINKYSLVFKWASNNTTQTDLKPYCLTAHLDVVPAPEPEKWVHPPFSGDIDNDFIWGRGAIDDKQNVFAILEAVEDILNTDPSFTPSRDIWLAFGHDEEIGGFNGAQHIAQFFFDTLGPNCFDFVSDEGLFIIDGIMPGHKKPIAFVCVAEKGHVDVELTVNVEPGHASAPPKDTAIGILSRAVNAIESNPMPPHFEGTAENVFESVRSGFSGALRFVMCNLWLFAPIVKRIMAASPHTATMVKTTAAVTIFKAGNKINLLPSSASVCINHRIHPSDSVESVLEWDRKVINDPRVQIKALATLEPAPVSSHTHTMFKNITKAIYQTFGDICSVTPGMFVANSDSKHYWTLTKDIYRFNPILLGKDDVNMFHGFNEKIGIDAYAQLVFFWRNIIYLNNDVEALRAEEAKLSLKQEAKKID